MNLLHFKVKMEDGKQLEDKKKDQNVDHYY